jgi:aryl-alcohol dehydrogenase-like predicted oxidoreductase
LFERELEKEVLPYCQEHAMAVLAYGPLCRGLLSGRMTAATRFTGDDLRRNDPKFQSPRFEQYLAAVKRLDQFAHKNYGKRVIHLALRWVLDRSEANIALWGARRPDQLAPLKQVMGWHIDAAGLSEIDRILSDTITNPVGPEFMAPSDNLAA